MSIVDDSKLDAWDAMQADNRKRYGTPSEPELPLKGGDGGGTSGGMEGRISALETHMEYVRRDLDSIDGKLNTIIDRTADLPTKRDLWAWKWQWTALAVATIAIVVGGIIGGLSWIKPDPALPAPVHVTLAVPAPVAPIAASHP